MEPLNFVRIETLDGPKTISVYHANILDFDEDIDILLTSAFCRIYHPTPKSVFKALYDKGLSVQKLSQDPLIDLRDVTNIWLSQSIACQKLPHIKRIGCVELRKLPDHYRISDERELNMIDTIASFFSMLDIASNGNVKMDTIALPILGTGLQKIHWEQILTPILKECRNILERNHHVKRICIIEMNSSKAFVAAQKISELYTLKNNTALNTYVVPTEACKNRQLFISYADEDKDTADFFCAQCERRGLRVWYAPRDVGPNDYATSIVNAIMKSTVFTVILSKNSLVSNHVLNEVDLAFKQLEKGLIEFRTLRIDQAELTAGFAYYLARMHWYDASSGDLKAHLKGFAKQIKGE